MCLTRSRCLRLQDEVRHHEGGIDVSDIQPHRAIRIHQRIHYAECRHLAAQIPRPAGRTVSRT
jgi:hypothetical protein